MNVLANRARHADGNEWVTTDAQFRSFYENLANCDVATDLFLAESAGELVGYARGAWADEYSGDRIYESVVLVDPDVAERQALMAALQQRIDARLAAIAAGHPPGPKLLQSSAEEQATAMQAVLRAGGYEPVRYDYRMVRPSVDDLPDSPLPPGLEIRDVRPEHLRQIWEADREAFRDHWGQGPGGEEGFRQFTSDPVTSDTTLWRIAWDGDEVAGQVRGFINEAENQRFGRKRGYVEFISTRRRWRRRGLARALIAATFPLLRARGMTEAALGVDTENPTGALRLYEACGFVPVSKETTYRKRIE